MASARERNGRWTALYRDASGAQRSAGTHHTQKAALKAAIAAEAIEATGRDAKRALAGPTHLYADERRGHVTVNGYAPGWLAGHRLEETSRDSYGFMIKHIIKGLGDVPVRDLDGPRVREFVRALEASGMSGATAGHVLTVLREMCRTAVADGLLDRDPSAGVKVANRRAREMTILSPAAVPPHPGRHRPALSAPGQDAGLHRPAVG